MRSKENARGPRLNPRTKPVTFKSTSPRAHVLLLLCYALECSSLMRFGLQEWPILLHLVIPACRPWQVRVHPMFVLSLTPVSNDNAGSCSPRPCSCVHRFKRRSLQLSIPMYYIGNVARCCSVHPGLDASRGWEYRFRGRRYHQGKMEFSCSIVSHTCSPEPPPANTKGDWQKVQAFQAACEHSGHISWLLAATDCGCCDVVLRQR